MSYTGRVLSNFLSKFPNFRYHGNKGRSGVYFNDTVKLLDTEISLFGATLVAPSLVIA